MSPVAANRPASARGRRDAVDTASRTPRLRDRIARDRQGTAGRTGIRDGTNRHTGGRRSPCRLLGRRRRRARTLRNLARQHRLYLRRRRHARRARRGLPRRGGRAHAGVGDAGAHQHAQPDLAAHCRGDGARRHGSLHDPAVRARRHALVDPDRRPQHAGKWPGGVRPRPAGDGHHRRLLQPVADHPAPDAGAAAQDRRQPAPAGARRARADGRSAARPHGLAQTPCPADDPGSGRRSLAQHGRPGRRLPQRRDRRPPGTARRGSRWPSSPACAD